MFEALGCIVKKLKRTKEAGLTLGHLPIGKWRKLSESEVNMLKKIEAAGLVFAYHNHAFEFDDIGGIRSYDILIEEAPTLNFILDTYWVKYAGEDYMKYIKLFGTKRMTNIHFKDMRTEPKGEICPCGEGVIDFAPIAALCKEIGVPYALVEQDNAPKLGDEFEQMTTSFNNLKHLF
jgi:sugar phosphate isomerase/epimerase